MLNEMNILAIGAHPDDIELGCGGVLLKSINEGHNVYAYTLTRGSASGDPEKRCEELIYSANYMGLNTLWIDNFPDAKLSLNSDLINHIEYFIRKSNADVVFTHSLLDFHHDHRAVASSTLEAGRYISNILTYEISITKDFNPQVFFDISDVIEDKIHLLNVFLSQRGKSFLAADAIKGLAQYRAYQSRLPQNVTHVEAFEIIKMGLQSNFSLIESNSSLAVPVRENMSTDHLKSTTIEIITNNNDLINYTDIIEYNPPYTIEKKVINNLNPTNFEQNIPINFEQEVN
jgi:LmbE family N-acetylglucosaminyl deacetylase